MAVLDNNVLSSLAKIGRLELIEGIFDSPCVPPAVVGELRRDASAGYDYVERIDDVKRYRGGWLRVLSPTEAEVELAEDIHDHTLSFTDAVCIAVAESRDRRLLTDDGHVGEIASQRDVAVWDLRLVLEASIEAGFIESRDDLENILAALQDRDNYRFSSADRTALFERL